MVNQLMQDFAVYQSQSHCLVSCVAKIIVPCKSTIGAQSRCDHDNDNKEDQHSTRACTLVHGKRHSDVVPHCVHIDWVHHRVYISMLSDVA